MSTIREGYLLIADITGYTMYLSQSELDHAQEILTALLELLVEHTQPPLVISGLAGDAVFSYGLHDNFFQAQTFVEMVEGSYVAFRRAIERMVLNNTCECNACANVSNLDLKFFCHYGSFAIQRVGQRDELVGSDVIMIHRLLKNHVTESTGFRAYTLYTAAVIRHLGLEDMSAMMTSHVEVYDHLGEINVWVQDMHPIWEQKRRVAEVTFPHERVWRQFEVDIDIPRELLWDYLIQPEYRSILMGSDRMLITARVQGRIGPGTVYQCYHGDNLVPQTILEWQPFERMIMKQLLTIPIPHTYAFGELRLVSTEGGTRLTWTISRPTGPVLGRALFLLLSPMAALHTQRSIKAFKHHIEGDFRARGDEVEGATEITQERIREEAASSLQT